MAFKYKCSLSKETRDFLENEEMRDSSEAEVSPTILLLCNKIKNSQAKESCRYKEQISGFNDYLLDTVTPEPKKGEILDKEKSEILDKGEKPCDPGNQVLSVELKAAIKCRETSVRDIIDLVSSVQDSVLESNLVVTWQGLTKPNEKLKFFELLSSHPLCSKIICNAILLQEIKKTKEDYYSIMDLIRPHITLFDSVAISNLVIRLVVDEDSFASEDISCLKEILPLLSVSQKSDLLSLFIDIMEKEARVNHLQILSVFLEEIPLNENLIERLVQLINRNLSNFIDDRFLGKVLLAILDCSSEGVSQGAIKELSQICNSFKGVMRFRINAALKKFIG